ncbi:polysaccharide biosynthesis C-terminal domain-containing protein [candidate division WOR-3 bacterium]|nr:polysaccharide biosynthesis C-terminal domain-containing protein [candidate division WOR-3 bacterium]
MNLAKASLYNLITKVILFFLSIFLSVLVVRLIGAEGKGILSVVYTFFGISVSFGFLSLGSGLIYYASKRGKKEIYINSGLIYSLLVSILLIILSLIFRNYFKNLFFKSIPIKYFYFGIGLIFLYCIGKITTALTRVMERPVIYNSALLINKIVYIFCLIGFWISKINITVSTVIISLAISLIVGEIYILFKFREYLSISSVKLNAIGKMLSFGIKEHIGVIAQKLNLKLDILIMSALLLPRDIGIYSIAVLFAQLIWYVPDSIGIFLYPQIAQKNDRISSATLTTKINRINLAIVVIIGIFLFFISNPLIPFMYGKEFITSVKVVKILLLGTIGLSIAKILTKYFAGIGRPIICSYGSIVGLIFNIPLLLYLIPKYGILGAAIATTLSYLIISIYLILAFLADQKGLVPLKNLLFIKKQDIKDLKGAMYFGGKLKLRLNETD